MPTNVQGDDTIIQDNNIKEDDISDLLILSEENNGDDILSNDIVEEESKKSDELISFDEDLSLDISNNKKEEKSDEIRLDSGLNEDLLSEERLDNLSFENGEEVKKDESSLLKDEEFSLDNVEDKDEKTNEVSLNSGSSNDLLSEKVENISLDTDKASVGTMSDIFKRAINELSTKSELNLSEISVENENISDFKEQIANLEAKVEVSNEKVSKLNNEQTLITKNIRSLERMKNTDSVTEIKKTTSAKAHNIKRRKSTTV